MHNLTVRQKLTILISSGLVFLILGCIFNFQEGLMLNNDFWRIRKDGSYTRKKDSVLCVPQENGIHFDIALSGETFSADMTEKDENLYFEFSNGWALELSQETEFPMEIGDIWFTGNYSITPLDFEAMGCRFEKALPVSSSPFYDEQGREIGQYHTLASESGEIIEAWETWDEPGGQTEAAAHGSSRLKTVELREGEPFVSYEQFGVLYVNESGEYLMNPGALYHVKNGYEALHRLHLARFLYEVSEHTAGPRGEFTCILLFLLFYCLGAVQWIWPQETAFFGSRWQFRNDPELSDEGLLAVRFGAFVLMIIGAAILFIPAFA